VLKMTVVVRVWRSSLAGLNTAKFPVSVGSLTLDNVQTFYLKSLNFPCNSLSFPTGRFFDLLFTWSGGSLLGTGTATANGGIAISTTEHPAGRHDRVDGQSGTWSGDTIYFQDVATFNNFGTFRDVHPDHKYFYVLGVTVARLF